MLIIVIRLVEIKKQIQSEEIKMTWTLFGMSFCYIICVAPIVVANVIGYVDSTIYLLSFILYWFQVSSQIISLSAHMIILQYALNFVIYAACCCRYRAAFTRYLQTTFPCLFLRSGSMFLFLLKATKIKDLKFPYIFYIAKQNLYD